MVSKDIYKRTAVSVVAIALAAATLVGCSSGGGQSANGGKVTISFLASADQTTAKAAKDLVVAFEKANPKITVNIDNFPTGTEGNNVIKTKLSTGTMNDVFLWNSGALLQTLDPDKTLVNLAAEPWQSKVDKVYKTVVNTSKGVYGAPFGTSMAGGVLYNKKVYEKLGLTVPTSWKDFMANSEKIKQAGGITPIIQTYGDAWTSQLIFLGNFANVLAQDPNWAKNYTANKAKFVDPPAIAGFDHMAEALKAGYFNPDFASATLVQGLKSLAEGTGAQYPILTATFSTIVQNDPDKVNDIGFFTLPADNPKYTSATIWQPNALYIPKSTTGSKLAAAKKFVQFASSEPGGCAVQNADLTPTGPYVTSACVLPADVPPLIGDLAAYFKAGKTAPALEFIVPVTAPDMQSVTVAVGSGISTPAQGAALADQQVATQAQQLGLPGW